MQFEEFLKNGHASPVAEEAIRRMARIFWIEAQAGDVSPQERLIIRQDQTCEHWDKLHDRLRIERGLVSDGSGIAGAIDSLHHWGQSVGSLKTATSAATTTTSKT